MREQIGLKGPAARALRNEAAALGRRMLPAAAAAFCTTRSRRPRRATSERALEELLVVQRRATDEFGVAVALLAAGRWILAAALGLA